MLTVNNNRNYSPSFGVLKIANNPETLDALKKCSSARLFEINGCGETLKNTTYLNGLIKMADGKLQFKVSIPRGFRFPGDKFAHIKIDDSLVLRKQFGGDIIELGHDTTNTPSGFFHTFKLTAPQKQDDGTVEYDVEDLALNKKYVQNLNLTDCANSIYKIDRAIKNIVSGIIKSPNVEHYEPFMSEEEIALEEATERAAEKHRLDLYEHIVNNYAS